MSWQERPRQEAPGGLFCTHRGLVVMKEKSQREGKFLPLMKRNQHSAERELGSFLGTGRAYGGERAPLPLLLGRDACGRAADLALKDTCNTRVKHFPEARLLVTPLKPPREPELALAVDPTPCRTLAEGLPPMFAAD